MMRRQLLFTLGRVKKPQTQLRWSFSGKFQDLNDPDNWGDLRKEALALYRDCLQSAAYVKKQYALPYPVSWMKRRIRMAFDLNSNIKDPIVIQRQISIGRDDLGLAVGTIYAAPCYLNIKYFGHSDVILGGVRQYQSRELINRRKEERDKRQAIKHGLADFTALPGVVLDEQGNRLGYHHPKGPLPPGESEIFARPPAKADWGEFNMPDPWNPHNRPEGPPDPFLLENTQQQHAVAQARMGPYERHRLRRFIAHEKKTRGMSEYEYLVYFRKNEVHRIANQFEMPEYEWAEARIERRMRRCKNENQEIMGPARERWVEKYKAPHKAVNYYPAIDYWCMVFDEWVPNYNRKVVEKVDTIHRDWNLWLSPAAHYAVTRFPEFEKIKADPSRNPLAVTMKTWVLQATPSQPSTATKPYDHPNFVNKWYTDNGLELALIQKEDEEEGLGVAGRNLPVLSAEVGRLKEEIGCTELTEQRYKGEWWNRGHIKLMTTLQTIQDMELGEAMLKAAGVPSTATEEEAKKKLEAHDWSKFKFTEFSYLRYPDGSPKGIHSWSEEMEEVAERWKNVFREIFSYDQCVPIWVQGVSLRAKMNKPVSKGGWTLPEDEMGFWDQLVSY